MLSKDVHETLRETQEKGGRFVQFQGAKQDVLEQWELSGRMPKTYPREEMEGPSHAKEAFII